MKIEKEQWDNLLDDAFGPPEAKEPVEESSIEETASEVCNTENPRAPSEEPVEESPTARRKRCLLPFLTAAGLLVVIVACVLFAYKNRPSPELIRCKEALEELQSRNYYFINQESRTYKLRNIEYFGSQYIQVENDMSYSAVERPSLFRDDVYGDTLYTSKVIRDGKTYTRAYYENDGPTPYRQTEVFDPIPTPWPLLFRWDDHNIQLLETCTIDKYAEYITVLVTVPESGCSCCEHPFYTLQFLFFEGKIAELTQMLNGLPSLDNHYTEHNFSINSSDAELVKAMINGIQLDP